jgi:dienelactone hydrolase
VSDWEARFRAARVGLPQWARDAPDRCAVLATAGGVLEVHSWVVGGDLVRATARPEGTGYGMVDRAGEWLWWFDDTAGDEFGVWRKQPFGSGPGHRVEDATGLDPAYPAGLALGPDGLAVVGRSGDGYGTEVWAVHGDRRRLLYAHREDAGVAALSEDGTRVALAHSEHGDNRHPDLRVLRVADAATLAELSDGAGRGLDGLAFAPRPGDPRLLVRHERHGRGGLLVWDTATGAQTELAVDGEVAGATWYPAGDALLVAVDADARTRLHRLDLASGALTPVGPETGSVGGATVRPDGAVWTSWSSAADPPAVRDSGGAVVLAPPGDAPPPSVPVTDVRVGDVHALLRVPPDAGGPLPLVVLVHGGPTSHDTDAFAPRPAAWVDAGCAVVQVNYRGSTGYGTAWRDAIEARIGHVELEDVVAVRDHLVSTGVADPDRVLLTGGSWGGFLTLLGLGVYPDRWAVGIAGVPVADYVAAYEDEMEALKAFDRSLFGGSPDEVPERYRDSSPLTYVDAVRAPVLVLAGENDPRCPIRQIDNYLAVLTAEHETYRFDAGHGSLVDDERVRQMRVELDFAARHGIGTGS